MGLAGTEIRALISNRYAIILVLLCGREQKVGFIFHALARLNFTLMLAAIYFNESDARPTCLSSSSKYQMSERDAFSNYSQRDKFVSFGGKRHKGGKISFRSE